MNAATLPEWGAALTVGVVAYLPIVAAVLLSDRDLPHLPEAPARDAVERARLLLALARHLETTEATR
ncbi:hypothetical protein ACFVIN_01465 [Streptomyces prasinus]|uniref:hypothetical protein n=1 Tax=Streptomyces prasinus TaxID=67345 RepID=UPI00364205D9